MTFIMVDNSDFDIEELKIRLLKKNVPFTYIGYYSGILEVDGLFTTEDTDNIKMIINKINREGASK